MRNEDERKREGVKVVMHNRMFHSIISMFMSLVKRQVVHPVTPTSQVNEWRRKRVKVIVLGPSCRSLVNKESLVLEKLGIFSSDDSPVAVCLFSYHLKSHPLMIQVGSHKQ